MFIECGNRGNWKPRYFLTGGHFVEKNKNETTKFKDS